MYTTRQLETQFMFNALYEHVIQTPVTLNNHTFQMPLGWLLYFDNSKSAAGRCHYLKMKISVSNAYIHCPETSLRDIADTLLHEFAHAMAGPYADHGPVWQYIAVAIGCSASVYSRQFIFQRDYKYVIRCPKGCVKHRHRISAAAHEVCPIHKTRQEIILQK